MAEMLVHVGSPKNTSVGEQSPGSERGTIFKYLPGMMKLDTLEVIGTHWRGRAVRIGLQVEEEHPTTSVQFLMVMTAWLLEQFLFPTERR